MTSVQKLQLFYLREYAQQFQKLLTESEFNPQIDEISSRIRKRLHNLKVNLPRERGSRTYRAMHRIETRYHRLDRLQELGAPKIILKHEITQFLQSISEMAEYLSRKIPRLSYKQKQDLISQNQAEIGLDGTIRKVHYILNEHYLGYRL